MQNKCFIARVISALAVFLLPVVVLGADNSIDNNTDYVSAYTEEVKSFTSDIEINEEGVLHIEETIIYDFSNLPNKHGIYRNIPYKYKARGGNFKLRYQVLEVTDEQGNSYDYEVSKRGNDFVIKIGSANTVVQGVKTYIIKYDIDRAINYFTDHDELYWNVTGEEWQVEIKSAAANIALPAATAEKDLQVKCFVGYYGGTSEDCQAKTQDDKTVVFSSNGELYSYQGLTVVFGWPKGIVKEPTMGQKMTWLLEDNYYLSFPIIVFILLYVYWFKRGRDPKGRETIIPQYEAPDNLSPAEIGTVYDDHVDKKDVSATLIDLAIRGYIKIKQYGKKKGDYELIKLKDFNDLSLEHEKLLLESMFGTKKSVKLEDLQEKFYKDLAKTEDSVYEEVTTKGYFAKNPEKARFGALFIAGVIICILAVVVSGFILFNWYLCISLVISGAMMIIFAQFMPRKTVKGAVLFENILGFKDFLSVTEKDRLKFHNPPKMIPALFEKFLPYAMALGVESSWAKNFESIYKQSPGWYEGYDQGAFNAVIFASAISNFTANSNAVLSSRPSSQASGGGSGFSGGGVGGGFGGGGGGSW